MKSILLVLVLILVVGTGLSATRRLQSPRAASQQPAGIKTASAPMLLPAAVIVPKPIVARFAWDASPDSSVTGYKLWWGIKAGTYTNSVNVGKVLTGSISNLVRGVKYFVAATAYSDPALQESPFSNEVTWPAVFTNYVGVGLKTNGRVFLQLVYTNPPGDVVLFEPFIWNTNDAVSVIKLPNRSLIVANTNQP